MHRFASMVVFLVLAIFVGRDSTMAYEVAPVKDGGIITGKVLFKGDVPKPKQFKVEKTPEVCGKEDRLLQEVAANNGSLGDVVVVIEGIKKGKPYSEVTIQGPPPGSREMREIKEGKGNEFPGINIRPKKCIFGAFTGVVANGKLMRFVNQDSVKHSPHSYAVKGLVRKSMFNQDLEGNGKLDLKVKFKKKKTKVVKIECDQHNHMQNWFYRVENPYFAFSSADGSFKIDKVPPGKYRVIAWHPKFKKVRKKQVTVKANGKVDVSFQFACKGKKCR